MGKAILSRCQTSGKGWRRGSSRSFKFEAGGRSYCHACQEVALVAIGELRQHFEEELDSSAFQYHPHKPHGQETRNIIRYKKILLIGGIHYAVFRLFFIFTNATTASTALIKHQNDQIYKSP